MTFGERLKAVREKRGLSQSEVGKLTKIHPQNISEYENDKVLPSVERLKTMVEVLQVSADYLLFDGKKKEENIEFNNPMLKEQFLLISKMKKEKQEIIRDLIDAYITREELEEFASKRPSERATVISKR